jgi:signal peptidase I
MSLRRRFRRFLREWSGTLVAIFVLMTFRSAVADWYDVPTGSMQPTILEGDRFLANKLAYGFDLPFVGGRVATWGEPGRGEVVVFPSPVDGTRLIKRVVAVGGDTVAMRDGRLVLNGRPLTYALAAAPDWPLPEDDTLAHGWFTEQLPGRPHPVMTTDARPALRDWGPVRVPDGQLLVLGDNRDNSADGRVFGFVPTDGIEARAERVVLSVDRDRWWRPRWSRFGLDL